MCDYRERKKPGLRAGYGRDLERRLGRLEEIVSTHARMFEKYLHGSPHAQEGSHLKHNFGGRLPDDHMLQMSASKPPTEQRIVASDAADIHPSPHRAYPRSTVSQIRRIQEDTAQLGTAPPGSAVRGMTDRGNLNETRFWHFPLAEMGEPDAMGRLPPHDLLCSLVSLYFEHINAWFPILHRETTFKALLSSVVLSEADCILLHAIVTTSMRFCNQSSLSLEDRAKIHSTSRQVVLLYTLENSNVRSLQAMVILALDTTGSINGPPAWNLLAMITRNIVHLGLASESRSSMTSPIRPSIYTIQATVLSEPETWIEDEERRRLFWGSYILDRYAAISAALDFGINENEIDRRLPCDSALFTAGEPLKTSWFNSKGRSDYAIYRTENLGSFAFYCELLGIIGRIHQFLKQPVDIGSAAEVARWQNSYRSLDDELTSWRMSLPEHTSERFLFQSSPGLMKKKINSCWIMLHVTYHTAIMRLHSSAAYPAYRSTFFKPSYNAIQRCIRAAKRVEDLSRWAAGTSRLDVLGPPFAFSLWVAARVLLVHASAVEPQMSPDIGVFVSILSIMGRHWRVAERYGEILNRVVQDYQRSRLSVESGGEYYTTATVKILADMRRLVRNKGQLSRMLILAGVPMI
jgi:Fungal specific transcription factor domain